MAKKGKSTIKERINRIEGQLQGVEKMIEKEEKSDLVINQIKAIISSLESLRLEIVKKQLKSKMLEELDGVVSLLK